VARSRTRRTNRRVILKARYAPNEELALPEDIQLKMQPANCFVQLSNASQPTMYVPVVLVSMRVVWRGRCKVQERSFPSGSGRY